MQKLYASGSTCERFKNVFELGFDEQNNFKGFESAFETVEMCSEGKKP